MDFLFYLVAEFLAYCGWRVGLCFIFALVIAFLLVGFDISVVWRYDIALFVVIVGIGTGVYWEVESKDLQQR
jgi:hypothetical protein